MSTDRNSCDRCGQPIEPDTYTNDIWALVTKYDSDSDPYSSGNESDFPDNYIVTCAVCEEEVKKLWSAFVTALRSGQTFHKE